MRNKMRYLGILAIAVFTCSCEIIPGYCPITIRRWEAYGVRSSGIHLAFLSNKKESSLWDSSGDFGERGNYTQENETIEFVFRDGIVEEYSYKTSYEIDYCTLQMNLKKSDVSDWSSVLQLPWIEDTSPRMD